MTEHSFASLGLKKELVDGLNDIGLSEATPVQLQSIPLLLASKDVMVQSQTGSGKTLAFLLPILHRLDLKMAGIQSLIISPTRELCLQTKAVAERLLTRLSGTLSCGAYIGGHSAEQDDLTVSIAVATPGRLFELLRSHPKAFQRISFLILDESDKLLGLGFETKLLEILRLLPKSRVSGLFSATLSSDIVQSLARKSLRSPATVSVKTEVPDGLSMRYASVSPSEKLSVLLTLLGVARRAPNDNQLCDTMYRPTRAEDKKPEPLLSTTAERCDVSGFDLKDSGRAKGADGDAGSCYALFGSKKTIVFFGTCAQVDFFHSLITSATEHLGIMKMHGRMDQSQREAVYDEFARNGTLLLSTDVAARGIDFKDVELVIHFDVPKDYTNIVHRSGRTARGGAAGKSLLFLMQNETPYTNFLKQKGIAMEAWKYGSINDYGFQEYMTEELKKQAVLAFVSYIRSYKEHILRYLLDIAELDYDGLAELYMLDRVPTMRELRDVKFSRFPRPEKTGDKRSSEKKRKRARL